MSSLAKKLSGKSQQMKMYAKGGAVKHDDEKQDRALIKKMISAEDKKEMKCGGKVKGRK